MFRTLGCFLLLMGGLISAQDKTVNLKEVFAKPKLTEGLTRYTYDDTNVAMSSSRTVGGQQNNASEKLREVSEYEETILKLDPTGLPQSFTRTYIRAYKIDSDSGLTTHPWHGNTVTFSQNNGSWSFTMTTPGSAKQAELSEGDQALLEAEAKEFEAAFTFLKDMAPDRVLSEGDTWEMTNKALFKAAFGSVIPPNAGTFNDQNSKIDVTLNTLDAKHLGFKFEGKVEVDMDVPEMDAVKLTVDLDMGMLVNRALLVAANESNQAVLKLNGTNSSPAGPMTMNTSGLIDSQNTSVLLDDAARARLKEAAPTNLDAVYEAMGLDALNGDLMSRVKQAKWDSYAAEGKTATLQAALDRVITSASIKAKMQEFLKLELDKGQEAELLTWLNSEEGKAVITLQTGALKANDDPAFKPWTEQMSEDQQILIRQAAALVDGKGLTASWVSKNRNLNHNMFDVGMLMKPEVFQARFRGQFINSVVSQEQIENMRIGLITGYAWVLRDTPKADRQKRINKGVADGQIWYLELYINAVMYAQDRLFKEVVQQLR